MTHAFIVSAMCIIFIRAVISRLVVVDEKNITLTSLCNGEIRSGDVIHLNTSVIHPLTVDCVINNTSDITLRGPHNSGSAIIDCEHNGSLSIINACNVTLCSVTITNCGTAITSRHANNLQLPNALKNQVIAVLLMNCVNIMISNVVMTDNLGINLVGINVLGSSILDNVTIQNVVPLGSKDSYQTSSAALFEFLEMNCNHLLCNAINCSDLLHNNSLLINNSQLVNNSNTLPEIVLKYFNSYYYYVSFEKTVNVSVPLVAPGLTVGFLQNDVYSVCVLVNGTKFIRNRGRFGGGLFVAYANPVKNYSIKIDNCIFQENSVDKKYIQTSYGASIIATSLFYGHAKSHNSNHLDSKPQSKVLDLLAISNSNFTDNSAVIGTCVYLYLFVNSHSVSITLDNLLFNNNDGDVATAVYAEDHLLYEKESMVHVTMTNITAKNNKLVHATGQYSKPLSHVNGMFVFFNVHSVAMDGSSNYFLNNAPGVMGLSRTDVSFNGVFHFVNNTTPHNGGAVYLSSGSTMIIENNSFVLFENNKADLRGGAVYSDSSEGFAELAAACPIQFDINEPSHIHINFSNNTAVYGGNAIYASQLYPCGWFPRYGSLSYNEKVIQIYKNIFNFSLSGHEVCNVSGHEVTQTAPHELHYELSNTCFNISDHQITSAAHQVCFCNNNSTKTCCRSHKISIIPGTKAKFCLMVVDNEKSPVRSVVHFMSNVTTTVPKKVNVSVCCTEVEVTFYGIHNKVVNVTLRPSVPLYTEGVNLTISFKDCSVGFTQEENPQSCVCNEVLRKENFCDENRLVIPQGAWMGKIGQSLYFKLYCDVAYCKYSSHGIHFNNNTSVCRKNRDGILCGKCKEDYSVVFGSQDCYRCYNYALVSLLGYAIVGIIVVFLLSVLKLTVDRGTINGVIFFANIVYITHNLLYIADIKALPGIFNMINLDVPTNICFYHGMTALAKYAISFIFPMYLWFLVLLMILLINRFPSVSRVIQSPAQLLATLIYLSYSKLLLIITFILTPIEVSEIAPTKNITITHYRWYHDPNVAYGDLRHLVLVTVSLLLFFVVLLPFAVVLTFPNYSLGFRCLVRFKPIIDSYTAPYKDRWGFWLGIRLLILIFFYILLTIQQLYRNPKDLLLIVLLFVIPLIGVQLYYKPYKNRWVNLLDTLFLLNILIGGCIILWMVKDEGGLNVSTGYFKSIIYFFLGVAALEMLLILLYHVMMMTSSGQLLMMRMYQLICCKKDHAGTLNTFSEHHYNHQPARLSYSEDRPLLEGVQDGPPRFRESLLEYDNLITPRSQS